MIKVLTAGLLTNVVSGDIIEHVASAKNGMPNSVEYITLLTIFIQVMYL